MSTATKLTYLNDTKQLLKENINNLGGNLTNEPFRQYASVLEGIYERLPKVSGIGASLSLSPSLRGKIKLNEIQGNTLQSGTPTPSSPVPIQSVTGLQNVEVCGKNMLDYSAMVDGYVQSNGTFYTGTPVNEEMRSDFIKVKPNTTYTFKIFESSWNKFNIDNWFGVGEYSSNNTNSWLIRNTMTTGTQNYITFTTNSATQYIVVSARGLKTATKVQLEIDNATTYEPYNGNTYEVNLGKNLYYMNYNDETTTNFNGVDITSTHTGYSINGTATSNTAFTLVNRYITLPAGTYTVSLKEASSMTIRLSKTNYSVITAISIGQTSSSFTLSEETKVCLTLVLVNGTQYNETNEVMIEKGNATSYSPYFTPIELNKINTYQDSIKKSTGKQLFDKNSIANGYVNADGTLSSDNVYRTSDFIPIQPNTSYYKTLTQSPRTKFFDSNKQPLNTTTYQDVSIGGSAGTFTTPNNAYYFRFSFPITGSSAVNIDEIMINEGSTALPYEPYGKVWYITKNIGEKIVEDNSGWGKSSRTDVNRYYIYNYLSGGLEKKDTSTLVCNYVNCISQNQADAGNLGLANLNGNGLMVQFALSNTDFDTLQKWKTFVGTYKPKVLYVLATPIYTVITNTELINQLELLYNAKSEDGTTNINVTSEDLSMILNVSVIKGDA